MSKRYIRSTTDGGSPLLSVTTCRMKWAPNSYKSLHTHTHALWTHEHNNTQPLMAHFKSFFFIILPTCCSCAFKSSSFWTWPMNTQTYAPHTHTDAHTSAGYSAPQWSGFGWHTSYIILTMYSAVNKKVSGWEQAPCNNKMHELSSAGPSVSILPLRAVRRKHMWARVIDSKVYVHECACDCVWVQCLQASAVKTPYNNRFT